MEEKEIENPFLRGKYIIKEVIGKGSFGKVYHGIVTETGSDVAIKEIKIPKMPKEFYKKNYASVKEEVFILNTITRNKITCSVSLIDTIHGKDESEYDYYFIVLSYYNGYSFHKFIENNNYRSDELKLNILRWFCEVRNCLDALHKIFIYHRDIKPANIMLHDAEPKLIDFGLSLRIGNDDPEPIKLEGTVKYFSKYYIKLAQKRSIDIKEQRTVLRFQDYWALLMSFYFIYTNKELYYYYDDYSDPIGVPQMKDKILADRYDNFESNDRDPFISMMERVIRLIKENDRPTSEMFEIIENFNI